MNCSFYNHRKRLVHRRIAFIITERGFFLLPQSAIRIPWGVFNQRPLWSANYELGGARWASAWLSMVTWETGLSPGSHYSTSATSLALAQGLYGDGLSC